MGGAQTRVLHGEMALLAGSALTKLGLFEGKLAAVRELFRRYLSVCLIEVDRVAEAGMEGVRGGWRAGERWRMEGGMGGAQTRVFDREMALLAGSPLKQLGLFDGELAAAR